MKKSVIFVFLKFMTLLICAHCDHDGDQTIKTIKLSDINSTINDVTSELLSNSKIDTAIQKNKSNFRQSSLAFVFDATGSMYNDLQELKKGAALILETMINRKDTPIYNYVFVPFRDPHVEPAVVTTDSTVLLEALEGIKIYGGGDCPERSLTGIERALNASLPHSYVYVFTDATAKDHVLVTDILRLVQRKKSQIVFVLTGNCNTTTDISYLVYHQIAMASSGQVFNLKKTEVSKVLEYVEKTLDSKLVNLVSNVNPSGYGYEQKVSIDNTLKKVTVSLAGSNPHLTIKNPFGIVENEPPKIEEILHLPNIRVINIIDPEPGKWTIDVGSNDTHSVKVVGISDISFDYGFFINDTDKIHETTPNPLRDHENHLLIDINNGFDNIDKIETVEILDSSGNFLFEVTLERIKNSSSKSPHLYKTQPFIPPDDFFYFAINGHDINGNPIRRVSSTAIEAQWIEEPYVVTEKEIIVPLHGNVTLKCAVESLGKSFSWWFRYKIPVQKKNYFSQSGVAEYSIIDVSENDDGQYVCNAKNVMGKSSSQTNIIVTGPLPKVSITPYNIKILSDTQSKIECIIESELIIIDLQIYFTNKLNGERRMLYPLTMEKLGTYVKYSYPILFNAESEGMYNCTVKNKMGSTENITNIQILPQLKTKIARNLIEFQHGENISILCQIDGTKYGKWIKLNDVDEYLCCNKHVSEKIDSDDRLSLSLNIEDSIKEDQGIYMCIAHRENIHNSKIVYDYNSDNSANSSVTLIYVEKPKILNNEKEKYILENDDVVIRCETSGIPKPITTWILPNGIELNNDNTLHENIMFQNDNEIFLKNSKISNDGNYTCKVENQYGLDHMTQQIIIWKPLEFLNKLQNETVKIQDLKVLQCKVSGLPVPKVFWYFNDEIIVENLSNDNTSLTFENVTLENSGKYMCVAENQRERITNEAYLDVIATKPIVTLSPQNMTFRPGKDIFIECTIKSDLLLKSVDIFFQQFINESESKIKLSTTNVVAEDNIKYYSHRLITSQDIAGLYSCIATNLAGSTQETIIVSVLPKMTVEIIPEVIEYQYGDTISFTCNINGSIHGFWEVPNKKLQSINVDSQERFDYDDFNSYTIFIENATKLDEGIYVCFGYRGESEDREIVNASVESRFVEKPQIYGIIPTINTEFGSMHILDCNASGIPLPKINWFLSDGRLIDSTFETISINDKNQLVIQNITDDEKYKCTAKNHLGSVENFTEILIWRKPYLIEKFKNITVNIYENIDLTCSISGIPTPEIKWYHNDNEIITFNSTNENKTISLNNVQIQDGGKYTCFAQNVHGTITGDVYIEITGLIPPRLLKNNNSYIIKENDKIEVVCRILEGKPLPQIYWQKNGMNISNIENMKILDDMQNNTFIIENVKSKDEGNYTCFGFNLIGIDKFEFNIQVHTAPQFINIFQIGIIDKLINDELIETMAGDRIALRCEAVGKPEPSIRWFKDDNPWPYSNPLDVDEYAKLEISESRETDAGVYSCKASNYLDVSVKKVKINVLVKPTMPKTLDNILRKVQGQIIILPCPVYGNPPPEVKWSFGNNTITPSDRIQIDINNTLRFIANLTDAGVYTCQAINKIGNTNKNYSVFVFIPPSILSGDNEIVRTSPGSSFVLECHSVGFPLPDIYWDKNGDILKKNTSNLTFNDSGRLSIANVTQNHSGNYTCNAENDYGSSQKIFHLIVNQPPIMLDSNITKSIELLRGKEEFNLPCNTNGDPQPIITWMRNGNPIVNGFQSQIKPDGTLSLKFLTENLSGKYTCEATNIEGSVSIDYELKIIIPPTLIGEHDRNIIIVEGSNTILECPIKPTLTPPKIEWYKDSELMSTNKNETKLSLYNITRHDVKTYSCLASNAMGSVMAKFNIIVHWPPSFLDVNTNDTHLHFVEGDQMKLICDVDANPKADIQWMKDLDVIGEITNIFERKDVRTHHSGDHTCVAFNHLGHVKKNFKINISALPTIQGPTFENVEVRSGHGKELECIANGIPKPEIKWRLKYPAEWMIMGDQDVLKSFNVSNKSQGVYYCEAKNIAGSIVKQFNLTVLELPQIYNIRAIDEYENIQNQSKDIFINEGTTVKISCFSYGNPSPHVQWIKNGIIFNETLINESHLILSNVSKKDSGRYTCISSNKIGSDEYEIHVEVLTPPHFIHNADWNETNIKYIKVRENQYVTLGCESDGNPSPDMYWFKDNTYLRFYDSTVVTEAYGQLLLINKITKYHAGEYKCVAKNKIGNVERKYFINVITPPKNQRDNTVDPMVVAKKGQDIYLECPINGNPKPTIRWIKNPFFEMIKNERVNITQGKSSNTLYIKNSTRFDSGNYSCILTNDVGMAEISFVVDILEPPKISNEHNKLYDVDKNGLITVKIRRGLELICNANGYPEPNISWYKDEKIISEDLEKDSMHISSDRRYLNIMDALITDSGMYKCIAENIAGRSNRDFNVKVLAPSEWGLWSLWSTCSVSCGIGYSKRVRKCQIYGDLESYYRERRDVHDKPMNKNSDDHLDVSSCQGNNTETRQCYIRPCKIDGNWSDWSDWTNCSVKCGLGSKNRERNCTNPRPRYGGNPCKGSDHENVKCNGTECSFWKPWSEWTPCSATCGEGSQRRYRDCNGSIETCLGNSAQSIKCSVRKCEVDGGWSAWSPWGFCSATCGSGRQKRTRQCNSPKPQSGGKNCHGGNTQFRTCIGIPSCNNLDRKNDVENKNSIPKKVHFSINGKLNGYSIKPQFADVDVNDKDGVQYATVSLQQLVAVKNDYIPSVTFNVSPNGSVINPSNKRIISNQPYITDRNTHIEFATGEKMTLIQRRGNVSKSGVYNYEIIVDGTYPNERTPVKKIKADDGVYFSDGCSFGFRYNKNSRVCEDINECLSFKNNCHVTQKCENTIGSYKCYCYPGYYSRGNGETCLDVDECAQGFHGCSHECWNTPGSFYCNCPYNLRLSYDAKTCEYPVYTNVDKGSIIISDVATNLKKYPQSVK